MKTKLNNEQRLTRNTFMAVANEFDDSFSEVDALLGAIIDLCAYYGEDSRSMEGDPEKIREAFFKVRRLVETTRAELDGIADDLSEFHFRDDLLSRFPSDENATGAIDELK